MRSTFRRIVASLGTVGLGLATTVVVGTIQPSIASAAASISNVSFKAPVHTSYNHSTGGGAWNTGSTTYVKGELQGTDYACGEYASFMLQIEVPSNPDITANLKAEIKVDFTLDATGQSGVALVPDASKVYINNPLVAGTATAGTYTGGGLTNLDNGFSPKSTPLATIAAGASVTNFGAIHTPGAEARLTFVVQGLTPSSKTIVRMDALIDCLSGASPTGNMQASLESVVASGTAGSVLSQTISGGNQTVNFRGVGNLGGLSVPDLSVVKQVQLGSGPCPATSSGSSSLTSTTLPLTVTYCYYVTNNGTTAASAVTLIDDMGTVATGDDTSVSLVIPSAGTINLDPTETATGSLTVTLISGGETTNVANVTATIGASSVRTQGQATVTINAGISFEKTVATDSGSCPGEKTLNFARTTPMNQTIKYCFEINNYETSALRNVSVVDNNTTSGTASDDVTVVIEGLSDVDSDSAEDDLEAGGTARGYFLAAHDTRVDQYVNQGTLTYNLGASPTTSTKTSSATVNFTGSFPVTGVGRLSVVKTQTSASPAKLGDTITYSIVVTNTGEVALDDVTVSDPNAVLGTCSPSNPVAQLRINLTITCTATHVVTTADEAAGKVLNTAIANGKSGGVSIPQTSSQVVETPVTKAGASTTTAPGGKKVGDTGTNRAGDQDPQTLPGTGYDTSGMLLGVWALVFGSLALIWSDRKRRA